METTIVYVEQQKINKWIVTDSDGTVVPFHSDPNITVPSEKFIEKLRAFSFENPTTGIMVLSGRKDEDLSKFYKKAFRANKEGKIPNVVLASENGAFLRVSTDPKNVYQQTNPLSNELKECIENIVKSAAGIYYFKEFKDFDDKQIAICLEMKTFGLSVHFRKPNDKADEVAVILDKIKEGFEHIVAENTQLHADFNAANAFTLELVSKGITMDKLANHDQDFTDIFNRVGLATCKPIFISYSGDDRGDWPALNVLNDLLNNGALEGYTSRPNNYSPNSPDVQLRTPNGPRETGAGNSFYVLGSKEVSAQEQHQHDFLDQHTIYYRNKIRIELSNRGLLPSQSGDAQTPPIVVLSTGDILIQEPERYKVEVLDQLTTWSSGKLILMVNGADSTSLKVKALGLGENTNLIAVSPKGQMYCSGEYRDLGRPLGEYKYLSNIVSANPERSAEIQLLWAVQQILVKEALIEKTGLDQKEVAAIAPTDNHEISAEEVALPQQRGTSESVPSYMNEMALAASPNPTARSNSTETRRAISTRERNRKGNNQRTSRW